MKQVKQYKHIILVVIIILLFSLFIYFYLRKTSYELEYSIDDFKVLEKYDKELEAYYFSIFYIYIRITHDLHITVISYLVLELVARGSGLTPLPRWGPY